MKPGSKPYRKMIRFGPRPPMDIDQFVLHPYYGMPLICEYNREWIDHLHNRNTKSLHLTYEVMRADPEGQFQRLFTFLKRPEVNVPNIVREASFQRMKAVEENGSEEVRGEYRLGRIDQRDPESAKVRKGVIKGYSEYLNPRTIIEANRIARKWGHKV